LKTNSNFPLTALHLSFTCEAITPIAFAPHKAGAQLRGAISNVMQRAYCTGDTRHPDHAQTCPVCWLVAANINPGEVRRGYSLDVTEVTQNATDRLERGQRFAFALTLFGSAQRYLIYFLLTANAAGEEGVGLFDRRQRGQFAVRRVDAVNPIIGTSENILAEGEALAHSPTTLITHADVLGVAEQDNGVGLHVSFALHFLAPMRLIVNNQLLKTPDFGVLFKHVLLRLDQTANQFNDAAYSRSRDEIDVLQACANAVRLMEANTRWVDVFSGSNRTGGQTPISGFVGSARYVCDGVAWRALLPWLLWGQVTQVGKDTVKGNGVFRVERLGDSSDE
jgi:hypothetical protein